MKQEQTLGLLVLGVTIIAIIAILGYHTHNGQTGLRLTVIFDEARGLKSKSPVVLRGIPIGEVTSIRLTPQNEVAVGILIDEGHAGRIDVDCTARIVKRELPDTPGSTMVVMYSPQAVKTPIKNGTAIKGANSWSELTQWGITHWFDEVVDDHREDLLAVVTRCGDLLEELERWASSPQAERAKQEIMSFVNELSQTSHKFGNEFQARLPELRRKLDEVIDSLERLGKSKEAQKLKDAFKRLVEFPVE